jgi:hypothetical protein
VFLIASERLCRTTGKLLNVKDATMKNLFA